MWVELAVASGMVLLTVSIHAVGLNSLQRLFRGHVRAHTDRSPTWIARLRLVVLIVLGLFVLHGLEIWLYAGLYCLLGAVESLRQAVYFSTITYGAIGYSDHAMDQDWRLVGAIEGINGVLLLGWTTAFFVTVMSKLQRR